MSHSVAELLDRANQLAESGHLEEALDLYESVEAELGDPDEIVTVLISQINCLSDLGRTKEARSRLKKAIEVLPADSPNFPHIRLAESRILAAEGRREEALRTLNQLANEKARLLQAERGLDLYKGIQTWRSGMLIDDRRYGEARPIIEELLVSCSEDLSVAFYAGVCYYNLGELELARHRLEDALRLGLRADWEWQARGHLAPIYYRDGALAKAKLQFERVHSLGPEIGAPPLERKKTCLWLARISRELGQGEEAAAYERLARSIPS